MQITPNNETAGTPEDQGAFVTNNHPLEEGQDQLVLVIDLRRVDPQNPDGSPAPDLAEVLSGHSPEKAQALSFLVDSIAEVLEFDTALSRVGFAKVVDFEPGTGSATMDEFRAIVGQLAPTPEPAEVPTEQPIEQVSGTTEEAGTDEGDDNPLAPTESTEPTNTVEPEPGTATPETLEEIPHDAEPEVTIDELVEDGTIDPPATEDSPVGDSIAADPGPVDPPTEG